MKNIIITSMISILFISCAHQAPTPNTSNAEPIQDTSPSDPPKTSTAADNSDVFHINPLVAPTDPNEEVRDLSKDWVTALGGMAWRTTNWSYTVDQSNTHSSYKINSANYTSYEGNLNFNKIYTRVGVSLTGEDQLISEIKKYNGYLGLGNILFRTEAGKFSGQVTYRGFSTGNITKQFDFDQQYRYAEAIYLFKNTPFFAGVRRTTWTLPLEIVALEYNRDSGQTVFDQDFGFNYTSLSIGMDYMSQLMMNPSLFRTGWGVLGKVTGNYGMGTAKIGLAAEEDGKRIYGGGKHFTETSFGMITAEMEANLGIMYAKAWKYFRMIAGVGYNYNLFSISSSAKTASAPDELTPVAMVFFQNHGPIFRLQALF